MNVAFIVVLVERKFASLKDSRAELARAREPKKHNALALSAPAAGAGTSQGARAEFRRQAARQNDR